MLCVCFHPLGLNLHACFCSQWHCEALCTSKAIHSFSKDRPSSLKKAVECNNSLYFVMQKWQVSSQGLQKKWINLYRTPTCSLTPLFKTCSLCPPEETQWIISCFAIFQVEGAAKSFQSGVQWGLWDHVRRYKSRHVGRTKSYESCLW